MQRCLVKAIALHGLGLYIYAGEDLPLAENGELSEPPKAAGKSTPAGLPSLTDANFQKMKTDLANAKTAAELEAAQKKIDGFFANSAKPTEEQLAELTSLRTARLAQMTIADDDIPF